MLRRVLISAIAAFPATQCLAFDFRDWSLSNSRKTDVIVVGAGAAGLSAAVEASSKGLSVIVLEKASDIGGNTVISGGFYSSVDPRRQQAQGINDSEQLFFEQSYNYGGRLADPKLVSHMIKSAQDSLEWLENLGMHFQKNVFELYGAHWPRSHIPVMPLGRGYIRALSAAALSNGVEIVTDSAVKELITDKGRVKGVVAKEQGKLVNYLARKAVILASGGFAANSELVGKYFPQLSSLTTNNTPESTGEAMLAAQKIGAQLVNMQFIQCMPGSPPGKKYRVRFHNDVSRFILINHEGKRFIREDASRSELRDAVLALPQKYGFSVIDAQGFRQAGILIQKEAVKALEAGEAWKANSIEELAAKLGVDPQNLVETVKSYNEGVRAYSDKLGKTITKLTLELKEPPFWACYAGMTIHYTEGGLKINEKAQCLDGNGKPIPGLYAAGAVTGNIHGNNRLGGNGLADAVVFGRTAGINAAKEPVD